MFGLDPSTAWSIGSNLVGGLLGGGNRTTGGQLREQRRVKMQELRQTPTNIRVGAERAGFNPLVFAGPMSPSSYGPVSAVNPMGDALVRSGLAIADGMREEKQLDIQRAQLDMERDRLEALREELKLTPDRPGIYRHGPSSRPTRGNTAGSGPALAPVPDPDPAAGSGGDGSVSGSPFDRQRTVTPDADEPLEFNDDMAPRLTFGGINWHGSGAFSSGQVVEDAVGENPFLAWPATMAAAADMFGATVGRAQQRVQHNRAFDEWAYRERFKWPVSKPLPRGWREGKPPPPPAKAAPTRPTRQQIDAWEARRRALRGY